MIRGAHVLALALVAGCFSPDLGDRPFLCGAESPRCPADYTCVRGTCVRGGGGGDTPDAPVSVPDALPGTPDAPPPDAGTMPDAGSVPDSGPTCTPGSRCVGDNLVVCSAAHVETTTACSLGCTASPARCFTLLPSNLPSDVCERTGLASRKVTGTVNYDTTACVGGTVLPQASEAPAICLLVHSDVSIERGAVLRATGDKVLAVVATGTTKLEGRLDVSGVLGVPGAGGLGYKRGNGFDGSDVGTGGGGAGHATLGAGGAGASGTGGVGGLAYGNVELSPIFPGSAGGLGCFPCTTAGAAGGGAVQLVACGELVLAGDILAGGEGGPGGSGGILIISPADGGGGGGSGGSILIEAGSVKVDGAIVANGGGGGGGGAAFLDSTPGPPGKPGESGHSDGEPAQGGASGASGISADGRGGNGASFATGPQTGTLGLTGQGDGGGGGAVGRIRFNTRDARPPVLGNSGKVSPAGSVGAVRKR